MRDQWVDVGKSSEEIIVFTNLTLRVWLKKDDSTMIQIFQDSDVDWLKLRDNERNLPEPSGSVLNQLQQEFRIKYARECEPLTRKYLEALSKKQKQLVQEENMNEAIAIHEYMKKLNSGSRKADRLLTGIWKDKSGCLYDFSNKSNVAVHKPDGSLNFYFNYISTSPKGEWKVARMDRGSEKDREFIIFSTGEKIYIIKNNPDNYLRILTPASSS